MSSEEPAVDRQYEDDPSGRRYQYQWTVNERMPTPADVHEVDPGFF